MQKQEKVIIQKQKGFWGESIDWLKKNKVISALVVIVISFVVAIICRMLVGISEGTEHLLDALFGMEEGATISVKYQTIRALGLGLFGTLGIIGLVVAYKRAKAQADTAETMSDANKDKTFNEAVKNLGHESASVHLGGIYTLYELAKLKEEWFRNIAEILCAHLRETTQKKEYKETYQKTPSNEIQSLLYILSKLNERHQLKIKKDEPESLLDLSKSYLWGANLNKLNLQHANLSGIEMQEAKLHKSQIQHADLSEAQMQKAVLHETQMQKTNLNKASMQEADLNRAQMQGAILSAAKMSNALLHRTQMQEADLRRAQMQDAKLIRTQMQDADLRWAQMQGAKLIKAQMQKANLRYARMQKAELGYAQMQEAILSEALMQEADLYQAQMQGAVLSAAKMQRANLYQAQMQGANLSEALMQEADLSAAKLQGANLYEAQLQGANLFNTRMQAAFLRGAYLHGAYLQEVYMQGAYLEEFGNASISNPLSFRERIEARREKNTELGGFVWGGDSEDVETLENNLRQLVQEEKLDKTIAEEIIEKISSDKDKKISKQIPDGIITGVLTNEMADDLLQDYEEAMKSNPLSK